VPLVAGIVGVEAADHHGARLVKGGVVGNAEVHRFEPARCGGDRFNVSHAEWRFDQRLGADLICIPLGLFDLAHQALDHVDICRHADFGNKDRVELVSGLLHDVDDIAIHVMRVETVLPAPRQSRSFSAWMMFFLACSFSGGATASSQSRKTKSAALLKARSIMVVLEPGQASSDR